MIGGIWGVPVSLFSQPTKALIDIIEDMDKEIASLKDEVIALQKSLKEANQAIQNANATIDEMNKKIAELTAQYEKRIESDRDRISKLENDIIKNSIQVFGLMNSTEYKLGTLSSEIFKHKKIHKIIVKFKTSSSEARELRFALVSAENNENISPEQIVQINQLSPPPVIFDNVSSKLSKGNYFVRVFANEVEIYSYIFNLK